MSEKLDRRGRTTLPELDRGGVIRPVFTDARLERCTAYRLYGDDWVRIKLNADGRRELDSIDGAPEGWTLVGIVEDSDGGGRATAVLAPFHGHEWAAVQLTGSNETDE